MFAGFPDGHRLRGADRPLQQLRGALQFLRTTYKAAPVLVPRSRACIGAGAATAPSARARACLRVAGGACPPSALAALLAAVPPVAAAPLLAGRAIDQEQVYGAVPAAVGARRSRTPTPPSRPARARW